MTALIFAAQNGYSNVVGILLQHGASVDTQRVVSTLKHVTAHVVGKFIIAMYVYVLCPEHQAD